MKLILCAGSRHIEGYKHHDVKALDGIDYACDLYDIGKHVENGSCDEVQMTHALEHFSTAETQKVLTLMKDLLKKGGTLYIEVPNFQWHAQLALGGRDRDAIHYCFGGQEDEYDFHKTGFTPTLLTEELANAGFKVQRIDPASSISCWAEKL
jgi:predicted SAM-dependent methyltransferase